MFIKMRVTVTSRFCSNGYIAMQVSAADRVYELDGVWHKSLNSYRGTATVIRDAAGKNSTDTLASIRVTLLKVEQIIVTDTEEK